MTYWNINNLLADNFLEIRFFSFLCIELILATEYPTAGAQVSGVDCFYVISAKVYNGLETFTYTYTFKGLGNAKFELQGEPEVTK